MNNEQGAPRTEAMIDSCGDCEKAYHYRGRFADFARQLERELSAARATIQQVAINIAGSPASIVEWSEKVGHALTHLDDARATIARLQAPLTMQEWRDFAYYCDHSQIPDAFNNLLQSRSAKTGG